MKIVEFGIEPNPSAWNEWKYKIVKDEKINFIPVGGGSVTDGAPFRR
jgi:alcohol dehydrogenase YqhD (iron-dependent ADH family)